MTDGLLMAAALATLALLFRAHPGPTSHVPDAKPRLRVVPTGETAEPGRDPAFGWQSVAVADLAAAERLLDFLEANGMAQRELVVQGQSFQVRWRSLGTPRPAGA